MLGVGGDGLSGARLSAHTEEGFFVEAAGEPGDEDGGRGADGEANEGELHEVVKGGIGDAGEGVVVPGEDEDVDEVEAVADVSEEP